MHGLAQTPDQKRLDPMVGRWRIEVDLKATPLTQAANASGTEECEWFAQRHVVCRSEAKGAAGSYSQMRTFSYIPARKEYAVYAVDGLGTALLAHGQLSGDSWTFTTSQPAFNVRLTLKMTAGAYTAVAEYAGPRRQVPAVVRGQGHANEVRFTREPRARARSAAVRPAKTGNTRQTSRSRHRTRP